MSEMIERAAKAAYEAMIQCMVDQGMGRADPIHGWEHQREGLRNDWRASIRAAVMALREPTRAVMEAPSNARVTAGDYGFMCNFEAEAAWKAMLDEMLK